MSGSIGTVGSITAVYNSTTQQLTSALTRIASGKKFQSAAEDLTGFLRSRGLQSDISGYEQLRTDLTAAKTYTAVGVQAASSIYEDMTEMKELSQKYSTATDNDLKAQYTADFSALKTKVTKTLDSTLVDGTKVTATGSLQEVNLDPDGTKKLDINFTKIGDVSALAITDDVTAATKLDEQMSNMLIYMGEAKAFDAILEQQINYSSTVINSKQAVLSLVTDIDEAQEMSTVLDLAVRQQASVAMLAQGNMMKSSMSKLYE